MPVASSRAIFLSYAREDTDATRRMAETLRSAGIEVWFDQNELRGGDAWDAKIRKQVKECALFLPVISANTQGRPEGYFRLEWHLAEQRSHLIAQGRPFIVPVCVDDTSEGDALVPDAFLAVQWMRAPAGQLDHAFCERIRLLLKGGDRSEVGRSRPPLRAETVSPLPPAASPARWVKPLVASLAIVAIMLAVTLVTRSPSHLLTAAPPAASAPEKVSPARELLARARQILDHGSLTRAQLDTASELCQHALELDDTDALVWAVAADADLRYIYPYGYDLSDERRRHAQEKISRAANLAPDLFEVRLIQAEVFAHAVGTPALLAEGEKTIRALRQDRPHDPELLRQLAEILREETRFDEAARLFEEVGEYEVAAWSYFQGAEPRRALTALGSAPRTPTALQLKCILEYTANEDLDAAQAVVNQFQASELLSEMPASIALKVAIFRRDWAQLLAVAKGLPNDLLDSNAFRGPRGYFIALAYEGSNRPVLAEAEWRAALALVAARLKQNPNDRQYLLWSAYLHGALGESAEAERAFARGQALAGLAGDTIDLRASAGSEVTYIVLGRLRKREALLEGFETVFKSRLPFWELIHAGMRFNPEYDFLRDDPRFQKLLRDYLPPGAKPLPSGPSGIEK